MWAARCSVTGELGPPWGWRKLGGCPRDCRRFQPRGALPLKGQCPPRREGNASILVRFRLHFMQPALRTPSPGLEEELLQRGLRERLQGRGIPLAPYGTIVSAQLTGEWPQRQGDVGRDRRDVLGKGSRVKVALNLRFSIIAPLGDKETYTRCFTLYGLDQGAATYKYFHLGHPLGLCPDGSTQLL